RGIAGRITFPQRSKCRAIPGMHRLLEHVVVGTLSGKSALIDVTTCRLHLLLSTCRDFRMDSAQLWASIDGRGCSVQVVAGHREVAPFTVQLNGSLRMWGARHRPACSARNGAAYQDMNAGLARRVFGIAWEPLQVGLCPWVNAPICADTVVQVNARVVPLEHVAKAIIWLPPFQGTFIDLACRVKAGP